MVVTRQDRVAELTVLGPETRATTASIPPGAEFFGIQFSLGTFMPALAPGALVDSSVTLPWSDTSSVWFDGYRLELPGRDDVGAFVARLLRRRLLVRDPLVLTAVEGEVDRLSSRTVERRVAKATGLTRGTIRQIRRAERAVKVLSDGMSPIAVAHEADHADQPHLTRSLRRFAGQTPGAITASAGNS
jgi:AraC-like DNA-binding protein